MAIDNGVLQEFCNVICGSTWYRYSLHPFHEVVDGKQNVEIAGRGLPLRALMINADEVEWSSLEVVFKNIMELTMHTQVKCQVYILGISLSSLFELDMGNAYIFPRS